MLYILVFILGLGLGSIISILYFSSKAYGNLVITSDKEDGETYMFLELSKDDVNALKKEKIVCLPVETRE